MRHIPNIKALCFTSAKPSSYIMAVNLSGVGKCNTNVGRYLLSSVPNRNINTIRMGITIHIVLIYDTACNVSASITSCESW